MAEEEHDIPYKAEYAKSNRSSCKACKNTISKESLRIARMVQAPNFDGKIPHWYHYACFFKKFVPGSTVDVGGFHGLRWEDQEKIKESISGKGSGGSGKKGSGSSSTAKSTEQNNDFQVEYAKSNRSTCRKCFHQIDKGALRVARMEEPDPDQGSMGMHLVPRWHHYDCFKKDLMAEGLTADMIPGFKLLKQADKDMMNDDLGTAVAKSKKRGAVGIEETDAPVKKKSKEEKKEEKQLKDQSQLLWSVRDMLSRNLSMSEMRDLLSHNNQEIPSGESKLLDRCCDGMLFGALQNCTTCKGGQLVYSPTVCAYVCTGNVSGWTKCSFQTQSPETKPWKIPPEMKEASEELKKFKFVMKTRVFPKLTAPPKPTKLKSSESTDGPSHEKSEIKSIPQKLASVDQKKQPLAGLKVVIVGRLSKSQGKLGQCITSLGGTVVTKATEEVDICISKKDEVSKLTSKMQDVKDADVPVVDESVVLWDPTSGTDPPSLEDSCISDWGKERFKDNYNPSSKRPPSKLAPVPTAKKQKLVVKGGAVVDPDSGLAHSHHVYQKKKVIYNAVLGMVDIKRGTNSYYKLQILESDRGSSFVLFRSWGRVGTDIGGNKTDNYFNGDHAVAEFERVYAEKTGNSFLCGDNFVKHPNKFYPLEMDYGQDEEDFAAAMADAGSKSKLDPRVQDLIRMIFDVEKMKQAMMEFEIDMQKMPLGKLSKKQIQSAYEVLSEAQRELEGNKDHMKLLDCSNRFFTLIPHDFGMKKPPLLDNEAFIKEKTTMLDNLLEIEIAYSMMRESVSSGERDPIDMHYEKLKADIKPLSKDSEEFKMLAEYVANTHGATHSSYQLEIMDVFEICREGEQDRFKPFKKLHNHKLLWHGSRRTNFVGIISQGLRIAPPEAPATGYMFGKGVYFADMVSKSFNYCWTSVHDPCGLMLLCDVALGDMYELTHAKYVTKLPSGKHSTKGCGRTCPDPAEDYTDQDNVVIPKGMGTSTSVTNTSLLYNEYIVYDVAQIRMKYLLKMKSNYKHSLF